MKEGREEARDEGGRARREGEKKEKENKVGGAHTVSFKPVKLLLSLPRGRSATPCVDKVNI